MSTAPSPIPKSLIGKALWLARHRPALFAAAVRGFLLFHGTRLRRKLFPIFGVEFGRNVRLQNHRSVLAEAPLAGISVGDHTIIYENARLAAFGNGAIRIGEESILGDLRINSRGKVTIGKRFLSSWNVFIQDYDPHPVDPAARALQVSHMVHAFRPRFDPPADPPPDPTAARRWEQLGWKSSIDDIVIGDDVWAGANATILKGARIGDGCIIATGAVVVKGDYPARSILAGNPAKVVKTLSEH